MSKEVEVVPSPILEVVLELAKNAKHLTKEAQNAIALFVRLEAMPITQAAPLTTERILELMK